jgi:hypothetical protein
VRDVEHISELIKRRRTPRLKKFLILVIRDKASPEAALRYSNLYSRLQAQVLTSNTMLIQACIIKQICNPHFFKCTYKFRFRRRFFNPSKRPIQLHGSPLSPATPSN